MLARSLALPLSGPLSCPLSGPADAFGPLSLPSLDLWLDGAEAGTFYDATSGGSLAAADGQVARWEDKSGNARHATQATGANRPLRRVASVNGREALEFNGSVQRMALSSWPSLTAATAFAVCRPDATSVLWEFGTRPDASYFAFPTGGNGTIYDGFGTNDRRSVASPIDLYAGVDILEVVITSGTCAYYLNGAVLMAAAAATVAWSATPILGGFTQNSAVGFDGKLCEFVIYGAAHSAGDRAKVRNYLTTKWGASVS